MLLSSRRSLVPDKGCSNTFGTSSEFLRRMDLTEGLEYLIGRNEHRLADWDAISDVAPRFPGAERRPARSGAAKDGSPVPGKPVAGRVQFIYSSLEIHRSDWPVLGPRHKLGPSFWPRAVAPVGFLILDFFVFLRRI